MCEENNGAPFVVFLLGGAIGACLGLLFAPQAGKETRSKIKRIFEDISEKTGGC